MSQTAETITTIDAPFEKVWPLLADFDSYPHWNPFVIKAIREREGKPAIVGEDVGLDVRWTDAKGGEHQTTGRVTRVQEPIALDTNGGRLFAGVEYRYNGGMYPVRAVYATRVHHLFELADGTCRYETRETFRGWLSMFVPIKRVQAGFDSQTAAFKKWVAASI
jgi:hypothetical protein